MAPKTKTQAQDVLSIAHGKVTACILGTSPLIYNTMSAKTKAGLLIPAGKKTAAQKKSTLKHDVRREYRDSMYRRPGDHVPTRLIFDAAAFKGVLRTAALDLPIGVKRTEIGRLSWVVGQTIDVYGVPAMFMRVVRSADIARTPDVRTRAILPEWATVVTVQFVEPVISATTIAQLLEFGGMTSGVGDFRQEKGAGNYGQFRLCEPDDPDFKRIMAEQGREAQDEAIRAAAPYDMELSLIHI